MQQAISLSRPLSSIWLVLLGPSPITGHVNHVHTYANLVYNHANHVQAMQPTPVAVQALLQLCQQSIFNALPTHP